MKVVPIKPGIDKKPQEPNLELVAYFEAMKQAAERGEIQAYVAGFVIAEERDNFQFLEAEEWTPAVCFSVRLVLNELESPFESE